MTKSRQSIKEQNEMETVISKSIESIKGKHLLNLDSLPAKKPPSARKIRIGIEN